MGEVYIMGCTVMFGYVGGAGGSLVFTMAWCMMGCFVLFRKSQSCRYIDEAEILRSFLFHYLSPLKERI